MRSEGQGLQAAEREVHKACRAEVSRFAVGGHPNHCPSPASDTRGTLFEVWKYSAKKALGEKGQALQFLAQVPVSTSYLLCLLVVMGGADPLGPICVGAGPSYWEEKLLSSAGKGLAKHYPSLPRPSIRAGR